METGTSPAPLVVPLCVRAAAADTPDAAAVVDGGVRLTYADLALRTEEFARALFRLTVPAADTAQAGEPSQASTLPRPLPAAARRTDA